MTVNPNFPRVVYEVAFNAGAADATTVPLWTDISKRVIGSWGTRRGRQYELDTNSAGEWTPLFDNSDGAFDPQNSSSPYYPNVVPYRRARARAVWPASQNLLYADQAAGTAVCTITTGTLAPVTGLTGNPAGLTSGQVWGLLSTTPAFSSMALGDGTSSAAESASTAVTAGSAYTESLYVQAATGPGVSMRATINWYRQDGSLISMANGSNSSVTGSWLRLSVTGTAPAGAVWARARLLTAALPASATNINVTGWQLEQGSSATAWTTPGTSYPLFTGLVERWPQGWSSDLYGTVTPTITDIVALIAKRKLYSAFLQEILLTGPSWCYPLNEAQNSTLFADATANQPQMSRRDSDAGQPFNPGTQISSATSAGGYLGDPGPILDIGTPVSGRTGLDIASTTSPGRMLPASNWTRMIAFKVPAGSSPIMWTAFSSDSNSVTYLIQNSAGPLTAYVSTGGATGPFAQVDLAGITADGNWHLAFVSLASDGKTVRLWCDGQTATSVAATTMNPLRPAYTGDRLGFSAAMAAAYITQWPSALSTTTMANLYTAWRTAYQGETSGARTARILTYAKVAATTSIDAGQSAGVGPAADLPGAGTLQALQSVAQSEDGNLFVAASGVITFTGRRARYWPLTPAYVIGDNAAGGELPYEGSIGYDYDTSHIYNDLQISQAFAPNSSSESGAIIPASDATSQLAYGIQSLPRTVNLLSALEVSDYAKYQIKRYKAPAQRIREVTLNPSSNPALWSQLLATEIGTRVQVNRRPNGAPLITTDGWVDGIKWAVDANQGVARITLMITPVAPYQVALAAALHTTLAANASVGATTVTVNALTGSASNPAAAVVPNGLQLVLGYGTANAETVTVKSVATTSPGYTTVVLTLTAATTKSHSTSDIVCEPLPAGIPASIPWPAGLDAVATLTSTTPQVGF